MTEVGEELRVGLEKPHPAAPESSGRGRKRSRYIIEEKKVSLKNSIGEIQESAWQRIK